MSWKTLGLRRVSERTKKTCNLHAMLYSSQVCWLDRLVVIFATPHFSQWGCSWRATFIGGCVNLRREALPGCVLCLLDPTRPFLSEGVLIRCDLLGSLLVER